jgi:hypothetical protein
MQERRKFERFALELPARIEIARLGEDRETFDLLTSNVSAGGAFFSKKLAITSGTRVRLYLTVSSETLKEETGAQGCVRLSGTVVRTEPKGTAIRFDEDYQFLR